MLIVTFAETGLGELGFLVQGHAAHEWLSLHARARPLTVTQDDCTQIRLPVNPRDSTEKGTVWVHGQAVRLER